MNQAAPGRQSATTSFRKDDGDRRITRKDWRCCPFLSHIAIVFAPSSCLPSVITLFCCSIRNQRGNCTPILATVSFYCMRQRVFFWCPATLPSSRPVDAGIQDILSSVFALISRSTWN
jgi:hypothetical protein